MSSTPPSSEPTPSSTTSPVNNLDLEMNATIRGFRIGQKVFGRYSLERILGRGGMGVVWLAQDEDLKAKIALKFLPEVIMSDRSAMEELKQEVRRSRELTHSNIVRIHDFVKDDLTAAISMEYIVGDTLSNRKAEQEHRVFSTQQLRPWVEQICSALHYAHTKASIVHRDLKPANLMLDGDGEVKIADFGIARSISDSLSRVSVRATSGTPVYMSPQQAMGEPAKASDDVYALGSTLYELLTGKPPFHSGDVLWQLREKVPPTVATRRAELGLPATLEPVPESWEITIASCLAKDPALRPAGMQQLADRLGFGLSLANPVATATPATKPIKTAKPVPAQAVQPSKPLPRWAIPAGIAAGIVILGLLVLPGGWNRFQVGRAVSRVESASAARDWVAALEAIREVMERQPNDPEHRRRYADLQVAVLTDLRGSGSGATDAAFAYWATIPAKLSGLLEGDAATAYTRLREGAVGAYREALRSATAEAELLAQAGKYEEAQARLNKLKAYSALAADDLAASQAAVDSHRLRAEIQAALALAASGDTAAAEARLDSLKSSSAAAGEIKAAKEKVRQIAAAAAVERLARALAANEADTAQTAIADYARLTNSTISVTASALLEQRNLIKFLGLLEQTGIRPKGAIPRTHVLDLVVIESLRARFTPEGTADLFLADAYAQQARDHLAKQRTGPALLFAKRALTFAPSDKAILTLQRQINDGLRRQLDLGLVVSLPELPAGAPPELQAASRDAWLKKLRLLVEPIMSTATVEDARKPSGIEIRNRFSAIDVNTEVLKTERKTEMVQVGMKIEMDPDYNNLVLAEEEIQEAQKKPGTLGEIGRNAVDGIAGLFVPKGAKKTADTAAREVLERRGLLKLFAGRTNVTLADVQTLIFKMQKEGGKRVPNMVSRVVDQINQRMTYVSELTTEVRAGGRPFGKPLVSPILYHHETSEVKADAGRGIPGRPAKPPEPAALAAGLAGSIAQTDDTVRSVLHTVAEASLVSLEARLASGQVSAGAGDLRWGLLHLWSDAGVKLSALASAEQALLLELGFPLRAKP
jgi:serine/threonine protein kinase